jgi:hypothetical protein
MQLDVMSKSLNGYEAAYIRGKPDRSKAKG